MRNQTANFIPTSPQAVVIFHGTPSQVVNLPYLLGNIGAMGLMGVVFAWASAKWTVSPAVVVVPAVLCLVRLALQYVETAFTEIVIDVERITCRQGLLNRTVSSLALFRIQDVISFHPWWQRVFNVGTVVVLTSDSHNPRWHLPGMIDAEQMRSALNRASIALRDRKGIREMNMGRI